MPDAINQRRPGTHWSRYNGPLLAAIKLTIIELAELGARLWRKRIHFGKPLLERDFHTVRFSSGFTGGLAHAGSGKSGCGCEAARSLRRNRQTVKDGLYRRRKKR
jgi:hypothetical protein